MNRVGTAGRTAAGLYARGRHKKKSSNLMAAYSFSPTLNPSFRHPPLIRSVN
jgi:hypothetical protein